MINTAILELLSAAHLEHFKKIKCISYNLPLGKFMEEYCLSINVGRQFGHSYFVSKTFEKDPYSIIVTNTSTRLSHHLNMSSKEVMEHPRIFNVNSNNKGKRIYLEDNVIYTLLVDRGSYWKSNRNICEDVSKMLRETFEPFENIKNVRLIIVG